MKRHNLQVLLVIVIISAWSGVSKAGRLGPSLLSAPQSGPGQSNSTSDAQSQQTNLKAATLLHHPPAQTYTGKIISKKGELFLKNDAGPGFYKLDDPAKAKHYKGKHVIVTGSLDSQRHTMHVLYVEPGDSSAKTNSKSK
jgi:hypothetical protein